MVVNRIYKPDHFDRFAVIPTDIFRKKGITMAASGLYCWLFSHDANQKMTMAFIQGHFKDGKDAITTKIKELESFGFLNREEVRENGKFSGYNFRLIVPTIAEKTVAGKTAAVNPHQSNIYNNIQYHVQDNIQDNVQYHNKESNIPQSVKTALQHFIILFPKKYQPKTDAQKLKWANCLERIERIDGYDLRKVYEMVKKMREDQFWSGNFLSILKLRNKDKNGILWVDRFMDMQKSGKPQAFKMIPNLIKFYKYNDPAGKPMIGAITKGAELDDFALVYKLGTTEYENLKQYLDGKQ
jgi:hypothetical protein